VPIHTTSEDKDLAVRRFSAVGKHQEFLLHAKASV
jgi:hypothetical protein